MKALRRLPDFLPDRASYGLTVRVTGWLFMAGAALVMLSQVLPHPDAVNQTVLFILEVIAIVVGVALVGWADRVPLWLLHATIVGGSAMICIAIYYSDNAAGIYSRMFIWVVLVTAYFFSARAAGLHLTWLLGLYGLTVWALGTEGGFSPLTLWVLTAFPLTVAAVTVMALVAKRNVVEQRAERFFELSRDLLCTVDREGRFADLNPAFAAAIGHRREELRGRALLDFVHAEDAAATEAEMARLWAGQATDGFENRYRTKDGSWRWLSWSATVGTDEERIYARATDVTEQKQQLAEASEEARTDQLTGLPNRRWLVEELHREISRAGRQGRDLCIAMLDLDHFKRFNDERGHAAGDQLLRDVGAAWRDALRSTDFLARFGGEEFVVLLPDCAPSEAGLILERLRVATPEEQTFSGGVARWNPGETQENLLTRADLALYAAKRTGRDRHVLADSEAMREASV